MFDIAYDQQVDAVAVNLSSQPSVYTRVVDDKTLIDYGSNGEMVGLEFLQVSGGVRLGDIAFGGLGFDAAALGCALVRAGIPVLDNLVHHTFSFALPSRNAAAVWWNPHR